MKKSYFFFWILTLLFPQVIQAQNWNQLLKTVSGDRNTLNYSLRGDDRFGFSVSIDGNYAVVGAPDDGKDNYGNAFLSRAGSATIFKKVNGDWVPVKKLTPADRVSDDAFGWSVAISGTTVVVGAHKQAGDAYNSRYNFKMNAGAVYIFSKDQGGTDTWGLVRKVVAFDRESEDHYGRSVAIDGTTVVVGTENSGNNPSGGDYISNAGAAYILGKDQGGVNNWGLIRKVVSPSREMFGYFGKSVAISDSTIAIGASWEDYGLNTLNYFTGAGTAYVFNRNQGGTNNWGLVRRLVATDRAREDQFGHSIAISGSTVVVGAYQQDYNSNGTDSIPNAGAAYIFSRNQGGSDNWGQVNKIVSATRDTGSLFGTSVAISGDVVSVGAPNEFKDVNGANPWPATGAAYVFTKNQGGTGNWGQLKRIVASDRSSYSRFGESIAASGDDIVVSAPLDSRDITGNNPVGWAGSIYMINKNQGGPDNWGQRQKLAMGYVNQYQNYGSSVAVDGAYAVVGVKGDGIGASGSTEFIRGAGSAYIYKSVNGVWTPIKKITASSRELNAYFGARVAIRGNTIVIGAYGVNDSLAYPFVLGAGAVYVFNKDQGGIDNWGQVKKIKTTSPTASGMFGFSVAIRGNTIAVGAPGENGYASGNTVTNAGAAYLFDKDQGGVNNWGQTFKISASDKSANDYFGESIDVSDSTVVVGASAESENSNGTNTMVNAGSAYIYSKISSNYWVQTKKIVASDRAAYDFFGRGVSINNNTIVIGAPGADKDETGANPVSEAGAAYVFSKDQGGINNWGEVKKIVAADRSSKAFFGNDIAVNGPLILVGATGEGKDVNGANPITKAGAAYTFGQNQGGVSNWGQLQKMVANDRMAEAQFGYSLAMSENSILIGSPYDTKDANGADSIANAGSAYFFWNGNGPAAVAQIQLIEKVLLIPNPTSDKFTITGKEIKGTSIQLLDATGRLLYRYHPLTNDEPIRIAHLPSGIYYLRFEDGTAAKILKQ
jgi:hypothetical protein